MTEENKIVENSADEANTAEYDKWFQAKVEEAISESTDGEDHDEVMDRINDVLETKRQRGRPKKIRPEDLIKSTDDHVFTTYETYQLSQIFDECMWSSNRTAVVAYLQHHRTTAMDDVFRLIYDRDVRFNVDTTDLPGMTKPGHGFVTLMKTLRNIPYLIRHDDNVVAKNVRERVLYTIFDEIVSEDYQLLVKIFKKTPLVNIPKDVAEEVIGRKL